MSERPLAPSAPRYLRFAQALALVSGLGACGTESAARPPARTPTPPGSAGTATLSCPCTCTYGSTNPAYCGDIGHGECCPSPGLPPGVIVGPLPPPDLAA